jgi:hypothetical protein
MDSCLFEQGARVTHLVGLGFLGRMRTMEGGDCAIQLEAHSRAIAFDHLRAKRDQQRLDA